jgi:hypothetical protein
VARQLLTLEAAAVLAAVQLVVILTLLLEPVDLAVEEEADPVGVMPCRALPILAVVAVEAKTFHTQTAALES